MSQSEEFKTQLDLIKSLDNTTDRIKKNLYHCLSISELLNDVEKVQELTEIEGLLNDHINNINMCLEILAVCKRKYSENT